jgi:hypothetical protein
MRRLTILAGLALGLSVSAAAGAQTCQGFTPFSVAPLRVTGDLVFGDNTTSYGASFAGGKAQPGLFGGVSISGTKFEGVDESAKDLGLFGGLSVPVKTMPGVEFCPVASFDHIWFPGDASGNDFSIGGAVGKNIVTSPTMNVVPFGDLRLIHASVESASDNYGALTLGAGIVFSKTLSVRPVIIIPIAQDGASTAFGVSLGWNFGGK